MAPLTAAQKAALRAKRGKHQPVPSSSLSTGLIAVAAVAAVVAAATVARSSGGLGVEQMRTAQGNGGSKPRGSDLSAETQQQPAVLQLEAAAQQQAHNPQLSMEAAAANIAFGAVLRGTQWYVETMRRQVIHAGGSSVHVAAAGRYGISHLAAHLEVHAIQLARQLLRAEPAVRGAYVQHLQSVCGGESPASRRLAAAVQDRFGLTRESVAGMLAQCAHDQQALALLAAEGADSGLLAAGYNVMHLLAHFGDGQLIRDAAATIPEGAVRGMLEAPVAEVTDEFKSGGTPLQLAVNRGFETAAQALRSLMSQLGLHDSSTPASLTQPTPSVPTVFAGSCEDFMSNDSECGRQRARAQLLALAGAEHGGWEVVGGRPAAAQLAATEASERAAAAEQECEISVVHVDDLSAATFAADYIAAERPLLIRNGSASTWAPLRRLLSLPELVRTHGSRDIRVSVNPYHDGTIAHATTLGAFARSVAAGSSGAQYYFESLPPSELRTEVEQHLPEIVLRTIDSGWLARRSVQLAIGGIGSGAPAHYHKAAVNSLYYGRKRWWLWQPRDAVYSTMNVEEWAKRGGPEHAAAAGHRLLQCVQHAGDVMFVPDFFGHAVMNLAPSVAVASEFSTPRMQFAFQG